MINPGFLHPKRRPFRKSSQMSVAFREESESKSEINISPESIHQLDRLAEFLEKQELLAHPLVYSYVNPISIHYDQTDEGYFPSQRFQIT